MNIEYKAIICDVDGTLYFQTPMRIKMGSLLIMHPFTALKVMRFRKNHEKGLIEAPDSDVARFMYELPLKYIKSYRDEYLSEVLLEYRKNGGKVIAYSDHPAVDKLKALEIDADAVYDPTTPGIDALKPDPSGLKLILEREELKPSDCLFIGDRYEKDGLCAKALNMDSLILSKDKTKRLALLKEKFGL